MATPMLRYPRMALGSIRSALARIYVPLDYLLGYGLTKRPTRASQIVIGTLAIFKCRLQAKQRDTHFEIDEESRRKSELLKDHGFVQLDSARNLEKIHGIRARLEELLDSGRYSYTRRDRAGEVFTVGIGSESFDFRDELPEIGDLFCGTCQAVTQAYYGCGVQVLRINLWRNFALPFDTDEEVFSNFWHVDPHTTDHLKVFVYLSDVGESDGPFTVGHGERLRAADALRIRKRVRPGSEMENRIRPEIFIGSAGAIAICNTTLLLHRAGIPMDGRSRDVAQFVVAPGPEPCGADWITKFEIGGSGADHNGPLRLLRY